VFAVIPEFATATTVPSIITAERMAAKIKPAVFIAFLSPRNTTAGTGGYV
jgi:hypothetical protein